MGRALIVVAAVAAVSALNLWTMWLFLVDKNRAANRRPGSALRIPESELLLLAAAGGTPGAYAARHLFRHKTRKQPFSNRLRMIAFAQLMALAALVGWFATA
ncbi:DUF1294 domain-containing protein [Sandaracinobacter neustonicus]|nr:DUF1294 domain-containing protein [Sandaracinobacter neustonicus]